MDFRIIFQLRERKFWWMDVIFYFVVSLLIATIFCYLVFLVKNMIQRESIKEEIAALETVGTEQQKDQEKEVISYQKKINDFSKLFKNHEFASHVFAFMQKQTLPNIWFRQFTFDGKNDKVQLSGEADDMEALSRQIASLERNEYVKTLGTLNSTLGNSARAEFNFNLSLDPKILGYVPDTTQDIEVTTSPSSSALIQPGASQKLITIFDLLLTPEVIGKVDQTNFVISSDVPFGTDVTSLKTSVITSPGATVSPASGAAQNFTGPVVYKVTAQDGSTQDYTVTVNILPKTTAKPGASGLYGVLLAIGLIAVVIAAIAGAFFFFRKKSKNKKTNTLAS